MYESFYFFAYFGLTIAHPMLLIYSEPVTHRLTYIARLLLEDLSGIRIKLTDNREEFLYYDGPKLNYSRNRVEEGFHVCPATLLFEKTVLDVAVPVRTAGEEVHLYPTNEGDLPFDVFAASFYLVTRYEEYIGHGKDRYGRFTPEESLASLHGFSGRPIVNLWASLLADRLKNTFPGLEASPRKYQFISTIDVDHAFAYKGRSLARTAGGLGRSVGRADLRSVAERFAVLAGLKEDPYDTFGFIREFHTWMDVVPHYFILFADYGGKDNNVSISDRGFRELIATLADESVVGIHPSLRSNRNPKRLEEEIAGLSAAAGREIRTSRQHFLKFSFPKTFRHLVTQGITDDFSMGFATSTGFRAGIAAPFRFFDLYRNEETPLTIHPFTCMDVTFRDYLRLTPGESAERIKQQVDLVRSVNGEFVSLWHNESLSDAGRWAGWRQVFEQTTAYAAGIKG